MDLLKLVNRMDEREARIKEMQAKGKKSTVKLTELYFQQKTDMFKRLTEELKQNDANKRR